MKSSWPAATLKRNWPARLPHKQLPFWQDANLCLPAEIRWNGLPFATLDFLKVGRGGNETKGNASNEARGDRGGFAFRELPAGWLHLREIPQRPTTGQSKPFPRGSRFAP